jgi:GTP-binding protein Era
MHEYMMKFIETALVDADIFLLVTEINDRPMNEEIIEKIKTSGLPVIVLINKIDLSDQEKAVELMNEWQQKIPDAKVIPVSALKKFNLESVMNSITELLPESPPFFPKDELTDKTQRFFVSEIIREKILLNYKKEVPYSVEVAIEAFKEEEKIIRIFAFIFVARETQKKIILGHQGKAIKKMATEARIDIEEFVGKKVYLELSVKVSKDWRENDSQLKRFGYFQ